MAVTILELATLCASGGLRHHLDPTHGVLHVVFVTKAYVNARAERLAIIRIETADRGTRCRVVLERAFATGRHAGAACLKVCAATRDARFVRFEHDAPSQSLRLVAEMPVEDGRVTARQLFALVDGIVEAAERGQQALAPCNGGDFRPGLDDVTRGEAA